MESIKPEGLSLTDTANEMQKKRASGAKTASSSSNFPLTVLLSREPLPPQPERSMLVRQQMSRTHYPVSSIRSLAQCDPFSE